MWHPESVPRRDYGARMSAVTRPRGPLPSRVYWTRRLVLVGVAFALVFGLARLLGGGGGGSGPSAQPVGADASSRATATTSSAPTTPKVSTAATVDASPGAKPTKDSGKGSGKASSTPLPEAAGPCSSSDVVVTPTIKHRASAGRAVVFALDLTTKSSPACDFTVSARTLVLKVTSGPDRVWTTQQCQGAVPKQQVVVRKDTPATIDMAWNGQRSDADCSRSTSWAQPGYYHAVAAAYGADPVDVQFRLGKAVRRTVTETPSPKATASGRPTAGTPKKH